MKLRGCESISPAGLTGDSCFGTRAEKVGLAQASRVYIWPGQAGQAGQKRRGKKVFAPPMKEQKNGEIGRFFPSAVFSTDACFRMKAAPPPPLYDGRGTIPAYQYSTFGSLSTYVRSKRELFASHRSIPNRPLKKRMPASHPRLIREAEEQSPPSAFHFLFRRYLHPKGTQGALADDHDDRGQKDEEASSNHSRSRLLFLASSCARDKGRSRALEVSAIIHQVSALCGAFSHGDASETTRGRRRRRRETQINVRRHSSSVNLSARLPPPPPPQRERWMRAGFMHGGRACWSTLSRSPSLSHADIIHLTGFSTHGGGTSHFALLLLLSLRKAVNGIFMRRDIFWKKPLPPRVWNDILVCYWHALKRP